MGSYKHKKFHQLRKKNNNFKFIYEKAGAGYTIKKS